MYKIKNYIDIFEVAIRIERNGINFYNKLYETVNSSDLKELFSILAAQREKHIGFFREILDNTADYVPRFKYPGEYELFLDHVSRRVLDSFKKIKRKQRVMNQKEALDLAIRFEIELIGFYSELYNNFEGDEKNRIECIVNIEKSHFSKLKNIKNQLGI